MINLSHINNSNIDEAFNMKDIIRNSMFYPASGIDGFPITVLKKYTNSFVYVDYGTPIKEVEQSLLNDFKLVGYELKGLKFLNKEDIYPKDVAFENYTFNAHELDRLSMPFIRKLYRNAMRNTCGYWAVYQLKEDAMIKKDKLPYFSLLHIHGEAIDFFTKTYGYYHINPLAMTFICIGEGYGDNWTIFRNTSYPFFQTLLKNHTEYHQDMPKYLLEQTHTDQCSYYPIYQFDSLSQERYVKLFKFDKL
jgi:hypothetical protein